MRRSFCLRFGCLTFALFAVAGRGGAQESEEPLPESLYEKLTVQENYWVRRVGYPTGRFDPRWVIEAREQDRLVPRSAPAGEARRLHTESVRTGLDPERFIPLGPMGLQTDDCQSCFELGIVAGRASALAIDTVDPNVAYFGAVIGGVWKTTNCCSESTTWTPVTDGLLDSTLAIADLTVDPGNHQVVYAGTGDQNWSGLSVGSFGVLKSTDQGATWAVKGSEIFTGVYPPSAGGTPQQQAVRRIRVDPRDSDIVVAGSKTGIFLSYDGGEHWTGPCHTNGFASQRQDVTGLELVDDGSSTTLFVAIGARGFPSPKQLDLDQNGANGVYRSTVPFERLPGELGPSHRRLAGRYGRRPALPGERPRAHRPRRRSQQPTGPLRAGAGDQRDRRLPEGGQLGVWRSVDGGSSWTKRSGPSGLTGCDGDRNFNWWGQGLAVDPNDPDRLFLGAVDAFRSTDGGTTFVNVTCAYRGGHVHADQQVLAFLPGSSSTLLLGNDGGVYLSTNASGATVDFTPLNDQVNTLEFFTGDITMDFANAANPAIVAGAQDNGTSAHVWTGPPGPATWDAIRGGDGGFSRIEPKLGERWYSTTQAGMLAVSTTGPMGRIALVHGGWLHDRRVNLVPFVIDKFNCPGATCDHLVLGTYRVWEAIDGGLDAATWVAVSGNLTKNTRASDSVIAQLAFAPSDSTVVVASTLDGAVQYGTGLNAGAMGQWTDLTQGNAALPDRPVLGVAISPTSTTRVFAAVSGYDQNTPSTPGHVFQATCDGGCLAPQSWTWADKSGNLPNVPAASILVNPRFPQQVFVGTDWGLYVTNNVQVASPTWIKVTSGLPGVQVFDMVVDRGAGPDPRESSTTLVLFTRSRGSFAWPLASGSSFSPTVFSDDFEEGSAVAWTRIEGEL